MKKDLSNKIQCVISGILYIIMIFYIVYMYYQHSYNNIPYAIVFLIAMIYRDIKDRRKALENKKS